MARHFLQLYLLIVITLAAVSWGQGRLWEIYSGPEDGAAADKTPQVATLTLIDEQLRAIPREQRQKFVDFGAVEECCRTLRGNFGVVVEDNR